MMHSLRESGGRNQDNTLPRLMNRRSYVTSSLEYRGSYVMSSDSMDAALSSRQNLLPKTRLV